MSKENKKKPGLMARLFSKKTSVVEEPDQKSLEKDKNKKLQRMHTVDPAMLSKRTPEDCITDKADASKAKARTSSESDRKPASGTRPKKPPLTKAPAVHKKVARKKRDTSKAKVKVDVGKPLEFPCTPETVLEYHKQKPILKSSEEWLIVELNEYECTIDSMDMIKIIAKHSKFFEVEPDELWEEFFEFVEEVPSYDEIINYDVWQEFRDTKYPM